MSNLGLIKAMHNAGIQTAITTVGDRYVIEEMKRGEYNLGGEQSGHIIFMDYATTGDGIISALHVLKIMAKSGKTLAELADFMTEYPQTLLNINVSDKPPIEEVPELIAMIKKAEEAMGDSGRCLIRYSGTENKIRVLVEAEKEEIVAHWINELKTVIEEVLV